jgi:hypothetical protein
MQVKLSTAARQAMAEAIIAQIDADSGAGSLKFYTGTQPAGPGTAITDQLLLGTLVLDDPAATATAGVITFEPITQDAAADDDGTCTWARLLDNSGDAVADFDVTNNAGSGAIKLNTVAIVEGGPIVMTSFTITMPGA